MPFYKGMVAVGRPYVKATDADAMNRNPGQWVRQPKHPKPSRLVPDGYLVHPHNVGPKAQQRVAMPEFRLACGRSRQDVYGTVTVDATPTVTTEQAVDNLLALFV